jgi:hypothetical protein
MIPFPFRFPSVLPIDEHVMGKMLKCEACAVGCNSEDRTEEG